MIKQYVIFKGRSTLKHIEHVYILCLTCYSCGMFHEFGVKLLVDGGFFLSQ